MKPVSELWGEAEDLRRILPQVLDLRNETHAGGLHKLRNLYKAIILLDLDYALDKKVEQDLWNVCFKTPISKLQPDVRHVKSKKVENSPMLNWFLESAAGFYIILLQELCSCCNLNVPFSKLILKFGSSNGPRPFREPKKASCLYIAQYCLIHLGDLARYRNQQEEAISYYTEAVHVEPSSGHPYNQLALLEAAGGNKLSTMYYYCRSLTLKHPFPPAKINLEKLHKKNVMLNVAYKSRNRLNPEEFVTLFLKFQAHIALSCELDQAEQIGRLLGFTLAPLIATDVLGAYRVIQMLQINMHTIQASSSNNEVDKHRLRLALELTSSFLNACLISAYSLSGHDLISFSFLPIVRVILDWFFVNRDLFYHPAIFKKQTVWSAAAKVFNELRKAVGPDSNSDSEDGQNVTFPEDSHFVQFSPLGPLADKYQFIRQPNDADDEETNRLRARRILQRAKWLAQQESNGLHCILTTGSGEFECPKNDELVALESQLANLTADTSANQKKGILKEVKILARKPRNVALAAILKQNTEDSKPAESCEVANAENNNKQVKFDVPRNVSPPAPSLLPTPLLPFPPPALLPTPPNFSHPPPPSFSSSETEPATELAAIGSKVRPTLGSRFASSVSSDQSWPNVTVPPPPVPPPGLGFRPNPLENRHPWSTLSSLQPFLSNTSSGSSSASYSLFNSQTWHPGQMPTNFHVMTGEGASSYDNLRYENRPVGLNCPPPPAPSLWSGPGPSPLERLLEQQKALRGNSPVKTPFQ